MFEPAPHPSADDAWMPYGPSAQAQTCAEAAFHEHCPAYAATSAIDLLRARDFARLDRLGQVYLDYTGGGLYAETQLRQHLELLSSQVFGNPHSTNPSSQAMTALVEQARVAVLAFLNAPADEYAVIFTPNASGALRLVGEAYPFQPGGELLLTVDNHNSVNGLREFARARGARFRYAPLCRADLHLDDSQLSQLLRRGRATAPRLFAYPAQSNFSGVQHPLAWIGRAREQGWEVLLDAAAFAPTNRLDLSRWQPDFVTLSFYKILGYPTGVGALIARRTTLARLRRPWFAGGTITAASVFGDGHALATGEAGFEDGTVNYLSLPAVTSGLDYLNQIGIDSVHTRVQCLTGWLLEALGALRHRNGARLVEIHGPTAVQLRGGTIALSLYDPAGRLVDYRQVEQRANAWLISLRTGCFCNPGTAETVRGLGAAELTPIFRDAEHLSRERYQEALAGIRVGAIRVSLGLVTSFNDVDTFVRFVRSYLDRPAEPP
jgi:selenocysteine lyase/cysteine desulfurase